MTIKESHRNRSGVFHLYMVSCESTGKKYIGITSQTIVKRWTAHKAAAASGSGFYLHKAIRKYGVDDFHVVSLGNASSWDEVCELEKAAIALHGTLKPNGYNLTRGGEGGYGVVFSARRRAKLVRQWSDPDFKERVRATQRKRHSDPLLKERLSRSLKAAFSTEKQKARRSAASKEAWNDPRRRENHSSRIKSLWADPEFRAAVHAKQKASFAKPEVAARKSVAMKKRWADPTYKSRLSAQASESMKRVWAQRREQKTLSSIAA